MVLSEQDHQALQNGEPVSTHVNGIECVVLRRDVYDQIQRVLTMDDAPLDADTIYDLIEENMAATDADDPALESYQVYKGRQ